MDLNRDPILARLNRIASYGGTGALRLSGDSGGVIYLSDGEVVYAESKHTPGLAGWPERPAEERVRSLEWGLYVREATVDASFEILTGGSSRPQRQRFRAFASPEIGAVGGMPVPALIAEVHRRQEIMKQLSGLLTADTAIVRNPHLLPPSLQVSDLQWALLIRVGEKSTPRTLAWELGHSVFSTTLEVFRLIALGLLSVMDDPDQRSRTSGEWPDPRWNAVSFLRAVEPALGAPAAGPSRPSA